MVEALTPTSPVEFIISPLALPSQEVVCISAAWNEANAHTARAPIFFFPSATTCVHEGTILGVLTSMEMAENACEHTLQYADLESV